MKKNFKKNQSGFTLIEMLVAVAIFVIVAIVITGALLIVIQSYRKAQSAKLVIDNLNFTMDQMTLDLREGTGYTGLNKDNIPCYNTCTGVFFRSRSGTFSAYSLVDNGVDQRIWSSRGCDDNGICASSFGMTDPQVKIIDPTLPTKPGFTLTFIPSLDQTDFAGHRKIIISINGQVVKGAEKTLYHLQSTVSQRNL